MQKLVLLTVLAVGASGCIAEAWAGETFLGRLYVSDAGSVNNASTGYGSAGCALPTSPGGPGACDQAFAIGVNMKLTLYCDEACCVSVNRGTTDAGICLPVVAGEKFPTSVAATSSRTSLPDGGLYAGGLISISPVPGASACRCKTFSRSGTE